MATYIAVGDTIEGASVDITTRKWTPKALVKHPKALKNMFRYKTDRNSDAVIIKSKLNLSDPSYHGSIGDKLTADSMTVYIDKKNILNPAEIMGGASGRHKAMLIESRNDTIATISTPLAQLRKAIEGNDKFLTSQTNEKLCN